ncbi:3-isopropylmalate dehydrogenase [Fusarium tjaetaba]|uniref:3-isopropylmalate dehydrogenase n=1 Tax=Fusarium tjaetaba TaxID=1567544 RepID=A0A8H5R5M5_9HYPO|nr:3-isopropylmalate dehydrogenase [Fusarium tjaetaba]KAF5626783.1 3-isopropylmalate dehydrogenase [Fusarium tjaetaba]
MSENKVFRVLILPGDHVGPEIMAEALKVLDIIEASRPDIRFERDTGIVGGCSIDKHGTPVTDAVLEKALASDAVLFGSIGGPEWAGVEPTPESGLLKLRQSLDAFANLRPCEILVPSLVSASPIKAELVAGTKFIVVRENCGGAYFGKKEESEDEASDLWIYSRPEVERLARVSAAVARILHASSEKKNDGSKPVVWSADKANVLASGRLWRRATTNIFNKELADIDLRHQLADSLAMLMVLDPKRFNNSVIHTDNTFGDVLSDISGGITGTLGVLPSASLAGVPGEGSCKGIYEPVHGSAPDISGKNLANPVAQILSLAMMLRYSFLLEKEADAIEQSVAKVLDTKESGGLEIRTKDLGGSAKCSEVGDAITWMASSKLPQQETGLARPKRRRIDRQRPDVTYSRKRAIAACRICRVKKIKCNNVRPVCGSCVSSQSTCVYESSGEDHSSFDPASIAILQRLNQVLESVGDIPGIIKANVETALKNAASPASRVDAFSDSQGLNADDLTAPTGISSVESVLNWPILAGIVDPGYILQALSDTRAGLDHASLSCEADTVSGINAEHVHPVNPILDVNEIYSHSLRISETGIKWDGESCIVLIACALGCMAKPYDTMVTSPSETSTASSIESQVEELEMASAYFELARQRLGMLDQSLLAAQCHFFAGVYYMFTLAPLRAWSQFEHAANTFYIYWKYLPRQDSRLCRSFYWSCLKSQVELGLDLQLPQSILKDLHDAGSELPTPPEINACHSRQTRTIFPPPGETSAEDLDSVQEESWAQTMPLMAQITMGALPTNKLALLLYARVLELKCLIYRPFLYHAAHSTMSDREQAHISPFVDKGLSCHFLAITIGYLHYRNHITYYHFRSSTASALCIMAVVMSGKVHTVHQMDWRGDIKTLIKKIRYWEDEAPTAGRCADVLEAVMSSVEQSLL